MIHVRSGVRLLSASLTGNGSIAIATAIDGVEDGTYPVLEHGMVIGEITVRHGAPGILRCAPSDTLAATVLHSISTMEQNIAALEEIDRRGHSRHFSVLTILGSAYMGCQRDIMTLQQFVRDHGLVRALQELATGCFDGHTLEHTGYLTSSEAEGDLQRLERCMAWTSSLHGAPTA